MHSITLLTGSTGFLGRYLLRDLLSNGTFSHGQTIVALARKQGAVSAQTRVHDALRWTGVEPSEYAGRLEVCEGDVTDVASLESPETRHWLSSCSTVIHSAADTRFAMQSDGQPWKTNFDGTRNLFDRVGLQCKHWVQVSTAYTSPVQNGVGAESLAAPARYRNAYEESKHMADCYLRDGTAGRGTRLSIVRPGVIVGEWDTGKTCSYEGFYRPMQMLATLVRRAERRPDGSVRLPLRYDVPACGIRNLVPVDWVSKGIATIASTESAEGVYHLTPQRATTDAMIDDVMREIWQIDETRFEPGLKAAQHNAVEKLFYRSIRRVAPNWYEEPTYDTRRLDACLPGFACPTIDHSTLLRLLTYAEANNWGKEEALAEATAQPRLKRFECGHYLENFLTTWAPQSELPRLENVTAKIGFLIRGPGGGQWVCQMVKGDVDAVEPGIAEEQRVCFSTDTETFAQIVNGHMSTQQAFFKRRVEIRGEIETGLKLAMIFQQFVREFPYFERLRQEVDCVETV